MGRKEPLTVPIANVTGVDIETTAKSGPKGETNYRYVPVIFYSPQNGGKLKVLVVEWFDQDRARDLAGWIGEKLQELGWRQS
jgi:hypothetical protein